MTSLLKVEVKQVISKYKSSKFIKCKNRDMWKVKKFFSKSVIKIKAESKVKQYWMIQKPCLILLYNCMVEMDTLFKSGDTNGNVYNIS